MSSATPTPAGWYADPHVPEQQRYWDGATWTDHVAGWFADPRVPEQQRYWDGAAWSDATRHVSTVAIPPDGSNQHQNGQHHDVQNETAVDESPYLAGYEPQELTPQPEPEMQWPSYNLEPGQQGLWGLGTGGVVAPVPVGDSTATEPGIAGENTQYGDPVDDATPGEPDESTSPDDAPAGDDEAKGAKRKVWLAGAITVLIALTFVMVGLRTLLSGPLVP
jgi:hypothetical protein